MTRRLAFRRSLSSISTPDRVESRLGTLEFDDGAPSDATAALLYDHLDFMNGVQAFLGALPGASLAAMRRGFQSAGAEDNSFTVVPGPDGFGVAVPDRATATPSTSGASSTCRTGRWCSTCRRSGRRRGSSARSTTCGSGGSPTSAFPAPTARQGGRYLIVGPGL